MSFFKILRYEFKLLFGDFAVVLTILGGVILYAFLYPQPYAKQSVSSLGTAVVDYDKSDISRNILFSLNATPQIKITRKDLNVQDAKAALVRGEVKAIIVIPKDFKKDLVLNKAPTIAVGADSSYFLIYGGILEGAMKSVLTESVKVKIANLLKNQVPLAGAKKAYTPYALNKINLFNPNNSYTQYVVPAVFVLILQQTMLIGMGILGGGINERMRRKKADHYISTVIPWHMYLARFVLFGAIFFLHMLFYFGFSFQYFEVSRLASITDLLTLGTAFIFASLSFGFFLGTLFSSREIATPVVLFSSLPLVFSAGFVWPIESLPYWVYLLSLLFPSTPAIHGFLSLNQMAADFNMVIGDYALLWVQGIVYSGLALGIFTRKRRRYR